MRYILTYMNPLASAMVPAGFRHIPCHGMIRAVRFTRLHRCNVDVRRELPPVLQAAH